MLILWLIQGVVAFYYSTGEDAGCKFWEDIVKESRFVSSVKIVIDESDQELVEKFKSSWELLLTKKSKVKVSYKNGGENDR